MGLDDENDISITAGPKRWSSVKGDSPHQRPVRRETSDQAIPIHDRL